MSTAVTYVSESKDTILFLFVVHKLCEVWRKI